jgi:hypothetical protein
VGISSKWSAMSPNWKKHEADIQEELGLSSTSGSGNKWHDVSDGVTRGHYSTVVFPLMVDCKDTEKKSYSINRDFFLQWQRTAGLEGKTFCMPIRFEDEDTGKVKLDIVAIDLDTFTEMYKAYKYVLATTNS